MLERMRWRLTMGYAGIFALILLLLADGGRGRLLAGADRPAGHTAHAGGQGPGEKSAGR